jgi:hypothetical protein
MTMTNVASAAVYRLHVWIRQISPMIWRRLLVRSDSTIADGQDHSIIHASRADVAVYLKNIDVLWRLGVNPKTQVG